MPYNYYICYVTLENNDLTTIPEQIMTEDEFDLYTVYMTTLGNRPDLFPDSEYVTEIYGTE